MASPLRFFGPGYAQLAWRSQPLRRRVTSLQAAKCARGALHATQFTRDRSGQIRTSDYFPCMSLMTLVYISQPFGFDVPTLNGILLDARRCNKRDDITGALIVRQDLYMQLLEGPRKAVERAYLRIRQDDRHTDVRSVRRLDTGTRLFADWAMRDDPVRSWMWTRDDVASGAPEEASDQDLMNIFRRVRLSLPM